MIRILHISDFHLNKETLSDWNNHLKKAFLNSIKKINTDTPITLVAFTGDLIDMGGKDFSSISEAFNTFEVEIAQEILDELSLSRDKFIIIPGNHDISRPTNSNSIITEKGLQKHFSDDYANVRSYMNNILSEDNSNQIEKITDFKKFEHEFYRNCSSCKITSFESSFIINDGENNIGITAFNSAWRCFDDEDKGRIYIGEEQISRGLEYIEDCKLKIALMHHPFDWISEEEQKTIISHITKDYDILLTGHIHEGETDIKTSSIGSLFLNISPSGLNNIRSNDRQSSNGFTLIDVNLNSFIKCTYFRYNHNQQKFVLNTDLSEKGFVEFQISPKQSSKLIALEKSVLNNIEENHFESMNEHLISAKSEIGPKSIKDAFILPPIEENYPTSEEGEIENLDLQTIVSSEVDLLIFGASETGKTTLLYRLIIEYVSKHELLNKIPVYINFEEIGNKRLETCIREYLGCRMKEVETLLKENKIVLLLDNLDFTNQSVDKIKKLNHFKSLKNNPKIRLIATGQSGFSSIPNQQFLEECKVPFRAFYIKNLKSSQIRKMIKTWESNSYENEPDEFIEKMIDTFHNYALPSTAMSVSLYLWSLENKEKKPINHAVLLEIYIEIILEKLGQNNIYRDRFDFTNKVQLLAKIAHKMYSNDEQNYSVPYSKYVQIIEDYIKQQVGFDFDPDKIAEYFLERKIFVKASSGRIKFSFSCFFHFFLSKRMIFDNDFKDFVLNEERYFNFVREIDYYTALTRSDKNLLQLFHGRFKKEFKEIEFVLDKVKVDDFFTDIGESYVPKARELELGKIVESRPSEKMIEEFQNKKIKEIPDASQIMKKETPKSLEQLLILFCLILRNSEGVEDLDLKKEAYETLIKYTLAWTVLYREYVIQYVIKHRKYPSPIPSEYDLIYVLRSIPYHIQLGLYRYLGTPKLGPVILDKIHKDLKGESFTNSDVEKYLSVALYTDIQGADYQKFFKKSVKKVGNNVVRDYYLYKLIEYFYKRSKPGSPNETYYLDLLTDLKIKSQSNLSKKMKGALKQKIEKGKQVFLNKSDE